MTETPTPQPAPLALTADVDARMTKNGPVVTLTLSGFASEEQARAYADDARAGFAEMARIAAQIASGQNTAE